jgi:hypothetical protein
MVAPPVLPVAPVTKMVGLSIRWVLAWVRIAQFGDLAALFTAFDFESGNVGDGICARSALQLPPR